MPRRTRPFRLKLVELKRSLSPPRRAAPRLAPTKPLLAARTIAAKLKATPGAKDILAKVPGLVRWHHWQPIATFSVCQKTGTALWLDLWDADHFDGFTDMGRCLADCRAWFSADGYGYWDSPQTKTGRVNCYFRAPAAGTYVCNVQLQSHGGPAMVECVMDSSSFGPLPFGGAISQPHTSVLPAGGHSFRIRQMHGSFFFNALTIWKV